MAMSDSPYCDEAFSSLERRRAFLKLPIDERQRILADAAEALKQHYEQDTEWRELTGGDVLDE